MNPYYTDEPCVISFSGGRSSAFMLYQILQAHEGKLPDYIKVCFANTGKEMPQTLDFVRDCGEKWGVNIVWLERFMTINAEEGKKYGWHLKVVDYDTASRNGEPFESLAQRPYLPTRS